MIKILVITASAAMLAGSAAAQVQITQAKAQAGSVTPGDTAGYPVTISQSGSYVLASNLTVSANQIGLQITAANVTIDLNGYTIDGAKVASIGIFGNGVARSVGVRNGVITRFKSDGIYATSAHWSVDSVRIIGNGRYGVHAGAQLHATNNDISENGSHGIDAEESFVANNTVSHNGGAGLKLANDSVVLGNQITYNLSFGINGSGTVGYGNNTILSNNFIPADVDYGPQVAPNSGAPLQPNYCGAAGCLN